jgi:putative hydrolase of the HAD superfamily
LSGASDELGYYRVFSRDDTVIDWHNIDTVLLDMDGTLLDLNYDNVLWGERLPDRYAAHHGVTNEQARATLEHHFARTRHTLAHYCLDHWAALTEIDLLGLHRELVHLVRYRSHAEAFMGQLRRSGRRAILVTNAHRDGLAIKDAHIGLTRRLDHAVSSHDVRAPKEAAEFWTRLAAIHPYDPRRTLLIDDNAAVLAAAAKHGIAHLVTVSQPDSSRPPRSDLAHRAFNSFDEIMPP